MSTVFNPPTLAEWAEEVRRDPAPTWLVPDLVPADNLILLSGHPKEGKKTWLAMWAALQAAAHGHKVLIIYREGSRRPTLRRFEALTQDQDTFDDIFFHHRQNFFLDDGPWVKHAAEFIQKKGIRLVVVDTLAKSMQSDENSSQHVGRAVQAAEKLRDSGATVILVHHLRKSNHSLSGGEAGSPEPDKDLRGSSALAGAYETHWAVRSYPAENKKEKKAVWLVGGKEADWQAYTYDWKFELDDDQMLAKASLQYEPIPMPYITGKEDTGWE